MKKRSFIVLLLTLVVVVSMISFSNAEDAKPEVFTSEDYKYIVLDDGTADVYWFSKRSGIHILSSGLCDPIIHQ